jgi:spore maturation protein CgeB
MFYHSLLSDWNHGNAHFLRGVVTELLSRGHQVAVYEPRDAWSVRKLIAEHNCAPRAVQDEALLDVRAAVPMGVAV